MIRDLVNDLMWYASFSLMGYVVSDRAGLAVGLMIGSLLVSFGIDHDRREQDVELQ